MHTLAETVGKETTEGGGEDFVQNMHSIEFELLKLTFCPTDLSELALDPLESSQNPFYKMWLPY